MSPNRESGVDLVLLWHHHQPDYRDPADGRSLLPWVRLHATKDYRDMASRLERHPAVHCTFNFVPSLLDQLDDAVAGGRDALFDLLRVDVEDLAPLERAEVTRRCASIPPHALERWPALRVLARHAGSGAMLTDAELLAIECQFLLAWVDPEFFSEPEAKRAMAAPRFDHGHRDGLLALHQRLLSAVIPGYRALAERGQIELSASPYDHPILPLLVDVRSARRARPDMPLPVDPFAAPEDAARQIARARARHAQAFGAEPRGMWPSEGSVSPEAVAIAAHLGVRWMASDEAVLWHSLDADERKRDAAHRPWRISTEHGDVVMFFRDHDLSDRIGFVYSHWNAEDAAEDFVARLRRIADDHAGAERPVVTVALDGENCWEHYADDGGPFLEALYTRLGSDPRVRTRTPSEVIDGGATIGKLARLHSGSWIDADFHIWIGHPEKNRAWDLLARTRRALVESGATPESAPLAWESLDAAEGSDWFWWMGDDHYTPDKALFDRLFRTHLRATHERAGLPVPAWLDVPVAPPARLRPSERMPIGFLSPVIDGDSTHYYEWHNAGRFRLGDGGGSMHREGGRIAELRYGYDATSFYLRVDFARGADGSAPRPPGPEWDLELELLVPHARHLRVRGLVAGVPDLVEIGGDGAKAAGGSASVVDAGASTSAAVVTEARPIAGARCAIRRLVELAVPFAALGLEAGQPVECVVRLLQGGQIVETAPPDDLIRMRVPDERTAMSQWSA